MMPFSGRGYKKQRMWSSVCALGGLLLVSIGLPNKMYPEIFAGMNIITLIGAISFIVGIIYLIDAVSD